MKNRLLFAAVVVSILGSLPAFARECSLSKPVEVQYALEYVSVMLNGGLSILDPPTVSSGFMPEDLCADLRSYSVQGPTRNQPQKVVLGLHDQTCAVEMRLTEDARIEEMNFLGCEAR